MRLRLFSSQTAVSAEVKRFSNDMNDWWEPDGPARALHQLNPLRVRLISQWWGKPGPYPLSGASILDVGCGGGLLSEALARLGGNVTGIDASEEAVQVACSRLGLMPLAGKLDYRVALPEQLSGEQFDFVVSSEVIEHASSPEGFVAALAPLARNAIVVSTLNRSAKSYMAAIVLGEYVLGLVPPGTHDWEKFVAPDELRQCFEETGFSLQSIKGMRYNPCRRPYWTESSDLQINYMALFRKK
jgi:ubiquinone biosynthesis O-methyltransferase